MLDILNPGSESVPPMLSVFCVFCFLRFFFLGPMSVFSGKSSVGLTDAAPETASNTHLREGLKQNSACTNVCQVTPAASVEAKCYTEHVSIPLS